MPKNLLLADDSITIQKVVSITFASEDYTVTAVDNGEAAIAKAREMRPDVILADVVMPRKNGYEVCEAVKNDPALKHIPVLLLSGTFEAFDEARARSARADGHIAKPFESAALIGRVKELVEGKAPQAAAGAPRPAAAAPAPRPAAPAAPPPGARPPGPGMPPPGARPPGAMPGAPPAGARPPGPGMPPPGARPPGAMPGAPPAGARPPGPGMPPPGARPPGAMPPGARPPGAVPGAPSAGGRPPGSPMAPAAARPPAGARPPGAAMPPPGARPPGAMPGMPPAGGRPPGSPMAPGPARPPNFGGRKDPFGLGAPPAPARPAARPEEDWSDVDLAAEAPGGAPAADLDFDVETQPAPTPIELAEAPAAEPELAPVHAFVPPPEAVGHQPGGDGGEAALRDALSKASREVIERVVWEVVPQLAETIIRENLDRLVKKPQGR